MQKLIKEKKKQIQAQLAENDQVEQRLQDQLDLNYRLMNSDMMKAHMNKNQQNTTSVDLQASKQSNEQLQLATFNNSLESPRQFHQSVNNNTSRSLFMQFYENDLTQAREKTLKQLDSVREETGIQQKDVEDLKAQNAHLRSIINRYKQMAEEVNSNRSRALGSKKNQLKSPQNRPSSRNQSDQDSENTHFRNVSTSNHLQQQMKANCVDIRKTEIINLYMPNIFKQQKPIECILSHLYMIKSVFKPQKITLFILDAEMQSQLMTGKKDLHLNSRKISVSGEDDWIAVYHNEDDYFEPMVPPKHFVETQFTNQRIIIPMKSKGKTLMSL